MFSHISYKFTGATNWLKPGESSLLCCTRSNRISRNPFLTSTVHVALQRRTRSSQRMDSFTPVRTSGPNPVNCNHLKDSCMENLLKKCFHKTFHLISKCSYPNSVNCNQPCVKFIEETFPYL